MNKGTETAATISSSDTPPRRIAELQGVTFGDNPETALCVREVSAVIHAGDLVMIRTNASQNVRRFASMLQGLQEPRKGRVLFDGKDWLAQDLDTQFRMRGQMGRVFDGQGWVANLTVRENLYLAKSHHGADIQSIKQDLQFWMQWFQMGKLTRKRPSFVEASHLQVYQWIRAFLGKPSLLILERPMRKVASKVFQQFLEAVSEMRRRGTAVVWIAGNTLGDALESVSPQLFLDLRPDGVSDHNDFDFAASKDANGDDE